MDLFVILEIDKMSISLLYKGGFIIARKHYTIREKSYIIHTSYL